MYRIFKMSKFTDGGLARYTRDYRWSAASDLECEVFSGKWVLSAYTLKEFLNGDNGHFTEVTK